MTLELPTSDRLHAALRALAEIQVRPMNVKQMKVLSRTALDMLSPELSVLPAHEAWKRVRED